MLFKRGIRSIRCKYNQYLREKHNDDWIKLHNGKYPLWEVEIETINRCNGTCPFCPVNVNEPQREYAKMEDKLFYKIIDDLADMDYSSKVSLFSNNEPLLDSRLAQFAKYTREKLTNARICLYTNGTLLTLDKFLELIPSFDYFHIDNYNDEKKVNDSLKEVYEYIAKHDDLTQKVNFCFRMQNEILLSRGGQAPNKKQIAKAVKEKCLLPYRMMVIRPTGKVSLCCADALGKYTLGDLNYNTVAEIWNGSAYKDIREHMTGQGRKGLLLCENCDTRTDSSLQ